MKRWVPVTVLGVAIVSASGPVAAAAAADFGSAPVSFDGTAVSYGNLVTASNPSIPLGVAVDETAPEARTRLTSLGESAALATGPYLGDTLIGFVFAQPGGQGIGGANYPFAVATSAGDDPKDVAAPGLSLHAESGVNLAAARGSIGDGVTSATGTARVERVADGTRARSESLTDGAVLFDKLVLSGVRAVAETVVSDSGRRTSKAALTIGRLTARGVTVTVPATAPVGGGQQITGPDLGYSDGQFFIDLPGVVSQRAPVSMGAVQSALSEAGITMTVQQASKTATGIIAPAITFAATAPAPPDNPQYTGPTPVSITLGRAATSVTVRGSTDSIGTGPVLTPPITGVPVEAPAAPSVSGLAPTSDDGAAVPITESSGPQVADNGTPAGLAAAREVSLRRADLTPVYLGLVLLGLASSAALAVIRAQGVRYQWAS